MKRGEDREEIERLKSLIDGVDGYRRILPNNHVKSDSEDISRNNKNINGTGKQRCHLSTMYIVMKKMLKI